MAFSIPDPMRLEEPLESSIRSPLKRPRSQSLTHCSDTIQIDEDLLPRKRKPPTFQELDRLSDHTCLEDFGKSLQQAANAIFPANQISKYTKVDVLLLSWEDEDPKLPVSLEIQDLADTFTHWYDYDVERWLIPANNCHNRLQGKILQFLSADETDHLKIVYYGGHGRLTNHGQLAWTSLRDSHKDRCPTIRWSGIQSTLEESPSDVLILLDCCAAGVCTTDEGNGVTEMLAACAFNVVANGVGQFSFTHALNSKLRLMAGLPGFTIGYLYNAIFSYIQNWRLEDSRFKKPPIHLVLSQNPKLPRSIRLSKLGRTTQQGQSIPIPTGQASVTTSASTSSPEVSNVFNTQAPNSINTTPATSLSPDVQLPDWPRLLLSIRFSEDVKPGELSTELFGEWLRSIPALAKAVRVEAGFSSDSTLMLVSIPAGLLGHLAVNSAIDLIGTIRSRNHLNNPARDAEIISVPTATKSKEDAIPAGGASRVEAKTRKGDRSNASKFEAARHSSTGTDRIFLLLIDAPISDHEPFREHEKRHLITELLRVSTIPTLKLYSLFQEFDSTVPNWGDILIPRGRTLQQCKRAFELLKYENSAPMTGPSSLVSDVNSPNLPKLWTRYSYGQAVGSESPFTPLRRKRGRPSKADVQTREVFPTPISRPESLYNVLPSPTSDISSILKVDA